MSEGRRSNIEAAIIYQGVLDELSQAYMGQSFEKLGANVELPFIRRTLSSETILETEEDLVRGATAFARTLAGHGVNQFIRLVSEAEFLSPDYIEGFHVTHTLRNAERVFPSYSDRVVLKRDKGCWKMVEHDSAIDNTTWPFSLLHLPKHSVTLRGSTQQQDDVRRTAAEPLVLYQNFISELTAANLEKNFDAYCALCSFPYTNHCDQFDSVLSTPDDLRPFYDLLNDVIKDRDIDEFKRTASRAEFISGNRICGYHTATFRTDNEDVIGPFESRMILERTGTQWFLTPVTNSMAGTQNPYKNPVATDKLISMREIQERSRP